MQKGGAYDLGPSLVRVGLKTVPWGCDGTVLDLWEVFDETFLDF